MDEMTLETIVRDGLCTGCGACVFAAPEHAVSMAMDINGFLRPVANQSLTAADQAAIRRVCPGIGLCHASPSQLGVRYITEWGPVAEMMAGHAVDEEVRHKASSGGVLSALLIHLLESRKVDFVVHTRTSPTQPLVNETVFSTNRTEVLAGAGSRYAPAAPVSALGKAIARPGRFAFVGKPCDVAALRKILKSHPALKLRVPYLLSFMCAGTPSIEGTYQILRQFNMPPETVANFRYRGDGWPGLARAQAHDGRVKTMDYNTAWGHILNQHLQPRCKMCADGTGEFADIVCADAWYGKDGYPDFAEAAGRSLVIARTHVGKALLLDGCDSRAICCEPFEESMLKEIQPYQLRRKQESMARGVAAWLLMRPWPRYVGLRLSANAVKYGIWRSLRAFGGSASRILRGRL